MKVHPDTAEWTLKALHESTSDDVRVSNAWELQRFINDNVPLFASGGDHDVVKVNTKYEDITIFVIHRV